MAPKATGNQNRLDSNRKVVGRSPACPGGKPHAWLTKDEPRAGPPGAPGAPSAPCPASNPATGAGGVSPSRSGRRRGGGSVPLPGPRVARSQPPGRALRAPPKFPKGAESCGLAGGRLPRAASAGSSARQSRGARSGGMPARRLPAAPGGGLLRRDSGAPAHKRAPDGPTSGGGGPRLLSASWWADGAGPSRPPGPARRPSSFLRCARARAPRPCAPSRGRGTSEAQAAVRSAPARRPRPSGPPRRSLRTPRPRWPRPSAHRDRPASPPAGRASGARVPRG